MNRPRLLTGVLVLGVLVWAGIGAYAYRQGQTIQEERRALILRDCQDQNARHRVTIATLDRLISRLPEQQPRALTYRTFTALLINALVPIQDCDLLANTYTLGGKP